jgi:hypothetical protein
MYDREYELYDVFGKDPRTQPSMRYTSKLAYEKSKLSLLDLQCQQPISRKEILNFFQSEGYSGVAIFKSYSYDKSFKEGDALVARIMGYNKKYVVKKGVTRAFSKDTIYSFYTKIYESKNKPYSQNVIQLLKTPRDNAFVKTKAMFTDPFTSFKIFSKRQICVDLDKDYPIKQTLKQFDSVISKYSTLTPFLNAYLVTSANVMRIDNHGLKPYALQIDVDDYDDYEEAYAEYENKLSIYDKETFSERLKLIQKIRYEIVNFHPQTIYMW